MLTADATAYKTEYAAPIPKPNIIEHVQMR